MNLEQLGLDPVEIQEMIIERATEQIVSSARRRIEDEVQKRVDNSIGQSINELVERVLTESYQPVDDYGDPIREKTTLREEFKKSIRFWWEQKVDKDGNPVQARYHAGMQRYEYVGKKIVGEILTISLKKEMDKLITETREQVKRGISQAIIDSIDKIWK